MAAKVYPFKDKKGERDRNGHWFATVLTIASWIVLIVGIILCLVRLSDFNDDNMYLMGGIGCIVASVFIYCIGAFMHASQTKRYQQATDDVAEKRKH
ncbi:hypothetical protein DCC85_04685 [Paenibacillus sp. CAA11]|uniref:hypothetical protein n=1 Tax=Paenibacillus sp. CAA11 TaxID=1532905 RepID=UPI000D377D26|nr:hypothetical protein [Paenibacillus sp. CAA11]AWB43589.1 hypothetical protein DCC85_04685 [Paenibacillus sp. CAA11]